MSYLSTIFNAAKAIIQGLNLTARHAWNAREKYVHYSISDPKYFSQAKGIVTLEYPHETIPVPTNGRYKLHNEIDDCIVCDKCAKICPVDCIDIEPIKSPTEIGVTSDGTPKRLYAAKFDIDMAKCCFCGLCTTVCPTECLTMTPDYDFSVMDITKLNFGFGNMTEEEIVEKRKIYQDHQNLKNAAASKESTPPPTESKANTVAQPFKPKFLVKKPANTEIPSETPTSTDKKEEEPILNTKTSSHESPEETVSTEPAKQAKPKPVIKPIIKKTPPPTKNE